MAYFLFLLFIVLSLGLVLPGIRDTRKLYEFPFFMGVTFLGFMGPHLYGIVQGNYPMPEDIVLRGLTMVCLCVAMCWAGYQVRPSRRALAALRFPTSDRRLFHVGAAYAIVATYFFVMVRSDPGSTGSQWTGSVLRYLFFTGLSAPALTICMIFALRKQNPATLALLALALVAPLYAVYIGRRGLTFMFLVTAGFTLYYVRGYRPPRSLMVAGILIGTIAMISIAEYRMLIGRGKLDVASILDMNIERNLQRAVGKTKRGPSETAYGFYMMDSVSRRGSYEFGGAFWNMLVIFYVPGQMVGHDFKKQLQINVGQGDFRDLTERLRIDLNTGTTLTGIYSAYKQFGYFGCLLFFAYGVAYRHLWEVVRDRRNTIVAALYPPMVIYGMYIITHHIAYATTQFLFYGGFCLVGYIYARKWTSGPKRRASSSLERPLAIRDTSPIST